MFAKCGEVSKAKELLELHGCKNVVPWTALIAEYSRQGKAYNALYCFEQMRLLGVPPDTVSFASVLRACGILKALQNGEEIHNEIARQGLLGCDIVLGNALIDMYAKCGVLEKAQQVLQELPVRNVVSWNCLITGYVQLEQGRQALLCYDDMLRDGIPPDVVTFTCLLKACSYLKEIDKGEKIHSEIDRLHLLRKSVMLGTALVDMYAKCGALAKANSVLLGLPSRNVVTWNALITGYVQYGHGKEAMICFKEMQQEGFEPGPVTLNCILKACHLAEDLDKGMQIHQQIIKQGLLRNNPMLGNALVDMYAKCSVLSKAHQVLEELPSRDVVTWNALVEGFIQQGQNEQALKCFYQMQLEGISSDAVSFASALKACGMLGAMAKGEEIHEKITNNGLLASDCMLGNALVDMYVKCDALSKAQQVLEELPSRNVITWSTLIAGFVEAGEGEEALKCFQQMQNEGLSPDAVTFACILKACGSIGAIDKGEQIHYEITKNGLLGSNVILGNALIDMYVKCGALSKAHKVLMELCSRNVVSWSSLIAGYAQRGEYEQAIDCFNQMQQDNIYPDAITISCVLSACRHLGLVEEGHKLFENMSTKYGIRQDLDHYTSIIDLFGHAGRLDQAVRVIQKMPSQDHYAVWMALLGGCQKWSDLKLGRWAFEKAVQVDRHITSAYTLMANMYATAGMQHNAKEIEALKIANEAL
ncbi:hypothetical protein KP509_13G076800 [Ceratopteris richardii]|nr:hypothetical protein KP509_13G076800 [Ceratopteris richardii]